MPSVDAAFEPLAGAGNTSVLTTASAAVPVEATVDDAELAAQLAERLRDAHRRVASLDIGPEQKSSITRRLLVITDASKHSVPRASRRLDALLAELDQQQRSS